MKKKHLSLVVAGLLLITGCSSSDDNTNNDDKAADNTPKVKVTSYFLDSAVANLTVNCGKSAPVKTDRMGAFTHYTNEKCSFKLGDSLLGSLTIKVAGYVTPQDINPTEYVNIIRMLQTMDKDENLSNGIELPTQIDGNITFGNKFEEESVHFLGKNTNGKTLISADSAKKHFAVTETNIALANIHVSFGEGTGDFYLYENGTLSHDTAPDENGTRDTDIPGTWFVNNDADLSLLIGNSSRARIVHFEETPPRMGTVITSHGETGTITTFKSITNAETFIALSNKHVSFGEGTGEHYLYADGTLLHDTADGDTGISGTWFIDSNGDLSLTIGHSDRARIIHFTETPPKNGTKITSGDFTSTLTIVGPVNKESMN